MIQKPNIRWDIYNFPPVIRMCHFDDQECGGLVKTYLQKFYAIQKLIFASLCINSIHINSCQLSHRIPF